MIPIRILDFINLNFDICFLPNSYKNVYKNQILRNNIFISMLFMSVTISLKLIIRIGE